MSQRAPINVATVWLRVTRPMTVPSLMRKKIQHPTSKIQRSSNNQASNKRVAKHSCPGAWILELGASLELGAWCLALSLSFVHYPHDHPSHRTLIITDCLASSNAIG